MTYPVKYMVVNTWYGFKIIDTSYVGRGRTVGRFLFLLNAHLECRALNMLEGYTHGF